MKVRTVGHGLLPCGTNTTPWVRRVFLRTMEIYTCTLLYTILRRTACSIRTMYSYIDALHTMFYMPILCICIWYTKQLYVVVTHTHVHTHIYIYILYTHTLYVYMSISILYFWHISFGTYQCPQNKSERYPQNQFSFFRDFDLEI